MLASVKAVMLLMIMRSACICDNTLGCGYLWGPPGTCQLGENEQRFLYILGIGYLRYLFPATINDRVMSEIERERKGRDNM